MVVAVDDGIADEDLFHPVAAWIFQRKAVVELVVARQREESLVIDFVLVGPRLIALKLPEEPNLVAPKPGAQLLPEA